MIRDMKLRREEADALFGDKPVEALDNQAAEPTDRVTDNDLIEWRACVDVEQGKLCAYYYTTAKELLDSNGEETDDPSHVGWIIDHYRLH